VSDELRPTEAEMEALQLAAIVMARWFPLLRSGFDAADLPLSAALISVEMTLPDGSSLRTAVSWPQGEMGTASSLAGEAERIFAEAAAVRDAPNKGQG
jgi:hypothetical protein